MSENLNPPKGWTNLPVEDAVENVSTNGKKTPQKQYLEQGLYPIVDQGQDLIGGFTDDITKLIDCAPPAIVFGDHTKVIKLINQRFAPGADGVKVLKPHPFFDVRAFKFLLDHLVVDLIDKGYARHYQHLAKRSMPLPPLAEQYRIVAKIEELFSELDAGEESLRRARQQLGIYRQSLLKQTFEGKLTAQWRKQNPNLLEHPRQLLKRIQVERLEKYEERIKEWEKKKGTKPRKLKPLASVSADLRSSLPEPPKLWDWVHIDSYAAPEPNALKAGPFGSALKKQDYIPQGYKIYGQEQVISGDPNFGDYFISRQKYESLVNCSIQPRDILISLVGTVGKVLVLPKNAAAGIINPRLVKITPSSFLDPEFFKAYFESAFLKSLYKLETHGATMDVLNLGIIQALPIPLCSLPEQQEIVRLLDEQFTVIEQNEREIDAALKRSATLRQSILKKAFTGQLVPQDPNDEPAAVLLERIRKERETANNLMKVNRKSGLKRLSK